MGKISNKKFVKKITNWWYFVTLIIVHQDFRYHNTYIDANAIFIAPQVMKIALLGTSLEEYI